MLRLFDDKLTASLKFYLQIPVFFVSADEGKSIYTKDGVILVVLDILSRDSGITAI